PRPTGASRSYRLQGLTRIDEGQPAVTVGRFAVDHVEERDLQGFRDRPALPFANLNLVDAADRRNLCGRADKEGLIADVQHFAGEDLLNDGKAEILRQRDDGAPRNARQDGGAQRRRVKNVVANQEKVLAAAFAQVSLGVERDALAVAIGDRFHL